MRIRFKFSTPNSVCFVVLADFTFSTCSCPYLLLKTSSKYLGSIQFLFSLNNKTWLSYSNPGLSWSTTAARPIVPSPVEFIRISPSCVRLSSSIDSSQEGSTVFAYCVSIEPQRMHFWFKISALESSAYFGLFPRFISK